MTNLGNLEFKPEDFLLGNESLNPGLSVAYFLCDNANRILREKLSRALLVFGQIDEDGTIVQTFGMLPAQGDTHHGRLVAIERIEK